VVLDEPTSNLDPAARVELSAALRELSATLMVVTHDLPFALEVCPRSMIMDRGRIVADGRTADLLADRDLLAEHGLYLPWGFDPAVGRATQAREKRPAGDA
jgi:cobalt/nickel transport system ATP-binding protein